MKSYFILGAALIVNLGMSYAQSPVEAIKCYDETTGLNKESETLIVNDVTANKGTCLFRPATASLTTFWYGPYVHIPAGNYLVQFRMKVASNASSSVLVDLDVVGDHGGAAFRQFGLKPNMFKSSGEWQLISLPVAIPDNFTNIEIRGMTFRPGITDVYFDYVQVVPSDTKGIFSDELTISGNGNVGLGTTSPREKLSVNGNIRSKEIKVETNNWPDYVFHKDYQNNSIEEIKEYINIYGHLPEIPSASEAESNGISLGEMNKLLLKKIEELTLHLIEKDTELKGQKKTIEAIELRLQLIENKNQK